MKFACHRRFAWFLVLCVGASSGGLAAETVLRQGDWIVEGNQHHQREHIRLDGNLVLPAGTRLVLEDCTLEILGTRSREHLIDWQGGTLVTRNCTLGGFVNEAGVAVHTVFHLYEGHWEAIDTTVQYSYGISFHWAKGRGVLRGIRLKAGPRPDAIILSGEADVRLIDSQFPIGLGVYVDQGGQTTLNLPTEEPVTATYDASTLLPGVKWRLEMQNTIVDRWFLFVRNIGAHHPAAEITLARSRNLIVSLLGHNLTGTLRLSRGLDKPLQLGNVTLRRADEPAEISMWALYFSGDETDVSVTGEAHICELMHSGGRLRITGNPGGRELSIGCTTLELSGSAEMRLQDLHLGRPLRWKGDSGIGEATVADSARMVGENLSVRNVRFHTKDEGCVTLRNVTQHGKIERLIEGGAVDIQLAN